MRQSRFSISHPEYIYLIQENINFSIQDLPIIFGGKLKAVQKAVFGLELFATGILCAVPLLKGVGAGKCGAKRRLYSNGITSIGDLHVRRYIDRQHHKSR